jgi:hypothetical protein
MPHPRLPKRVGLLVLVLLGLLWVAHDSPRSFRVPDTLSNAYDRFRGQGTNGTTLPDAGDREILIDGAPSRHGLGKVPVNKTGTSYPATAPRIQLVGIWNARETVPKYLPNFFGSVVANAGAVDLLFVRYDAYDEGLCANATRLVPDAPNTREICLSLGEFWGAHADFVCARWGCSPKEREETLELVKTRKYTDPVSPFVGGSGVRADQILRHHQHGSRSARLFSTSTYIRTRGSGYVPALS